MIQLINLGFQKVPDHDLYFKPLGNSILYVTFDEKYLILRHCFSNSSGEIHTWSSKKIEIDSATLESLADLECIAIRGYSFPNSSIMDLLPKMPRKINGIDV